MLPQKKGEGRGLVNEVAKYTYLLDLQTLVKSKIGDWTVNYEW